MSKLLGAVLLFAVGLGLGLWIAFSPERRATVEQSWQGARDSLLTVQTDIGLGGDQQAASEQGGTQQASPSEGTSPLAPLSQLIADMWNATRQWWFSLVARLNPSP